jgi:Ca2+-binding RTX toxin-like protein
MKTHRISARTRRSDNQATRPNHPSRAIAGFEPLEDRRLMSGFTALPVFPSPPTAQAGIVASLVPNMARGTVDQQLTLTATMTGVQNYTAFADVYQESDGVDGPSSGDRYVASGAATAVSGSAVLKIDVPRAARTGGETAVYYAQAQGKYNTQLFPGIPTAVSAPVQVINRAPTISALSSSVAGRALRYHETLTLTPVGLSDSDGQVHQVQYFMESNNVAGLQDDGDTFLWGADADTGYLFSQAGDDMFVGQHVFYARCSDSNLALSNPVQVTVTGLRKAPPAISGFASDKTSIVAGQPITLVANAASPDDQSRAESVSFYRETNGVAGLQTGQGGDKLLATDSRTSGQFSIGVGTTGLAAGNQVFYAIANDASGASGAAAQATVMVQAAPPQVKVAVENRVLHITGTDGNDTIGVYPSVLGKTQIGLKDATGSRLQSVSRSSFDSVWIEGRGGNDVIAVRPNVTARLDGGSGDDIMSGGALSDLFIGGTGKDTVSYSGRTTGVIVKLHDAEKDGAPGENDEIRADVENITGGKGNDIIEGNALDNKLDGGDGDDTLSGMFGIDTLIGGKVNDRLFGYDRIQDGALRDGTLSDFGLKDSSNTIDGGEGDDYLVGGRGRDRFFAGAGRDTIRAADFDNTPLYPFNYRGIVDEIHANRSEDLIYTANSRDLGGLDDLILP